MRQFRMPPPAAFKYTKLRIHFGWHVLLSILCFNLYVEKACEWYQAQPESGETGLTFLFFRDAKLDVNLQNKSIISLYYVFNLKRACATTIKKRVFVNLDWLHSKLWKEGDKGLVNVNWNLQEFHNWQGRHGHPVALFLKLCVEMADFPVCVASSRLIDIYRPTRTLTNACLHSILTGGFKWAASQDELILYLGNNWWL